MLAELFSAVAGAVFSYAIEQLDPADKAKAWLKRDPARLGFQKALARTYAAFARQDPDYTRDGINVIFDITAAENGEWRYKVRPIFRQALEAEKII